MTSHVLHFIFRIACNKWLGKKKRTSSGLWLLAVAHSRTGDVGDASPSPSPRLRSTPLLTNKDHSEYGNTRRYSPALYRTIRTSHISFSIKVLELITSMRDTLISSMRRTPQEPQSYRGIPVITNAAVSIFYFFFYQN